MSSDQTPVILWFRDDLRLADNAALLWAVARGPVVPVFILDDKAAGDFALGGATRWWLHGALEKLAADLHALGVSLVLRRGDSEKILLELAKDTKAQAIGWNRNYEPLYRERDARLVKSLDGIGVEARIHPGFLLFEPEDIKTNGGTPYRVYTPFSRACLQGKPPGDLLRKPSKIQNAGKIQSDRLQDWRLIPRTAKWPAGLADAWEVGEAAAHKRLKIFIEHALKNYKTGRDRPDQDMTSRMSPYLHFGHISPRQIWHAIDRAEATHVGSGADIERYRLELLWREFSWHLVWHFPHMLKEPLTPSFKKMAWRKNDGDLKRWQMGQTGYPIVDAGMRQLWQTGWMHNRVRMIVASFLIKDLLIDWREGMMWFWDTLVDADLGNNTNSWQWVAGCGADAAPFFRIFNPTLQGQKFDPDGSYVREFVPELATLDTAYIHEPWKAPASALQKAKIALGQTYPEPMVDHGVARARALEHLAKTKGGT